MLSLTATISTCPASGFCPAAGGPARSGAVEQRRLPDFALRQSQSPGAEAWLRRHMGGVVGQRLWSELPGQPCLIWNPAKWDEDARLQPATASRYSVTCARSFGRPQHEPTALVEAVATFVARATAKLRHHNLAAHVVTVLLGPDRYAPPDGPQPTRQYCAWPRPPTTLACSPKPPCGACTGCAAPACHTTAPACCSADLNPRGKRSWGFLRHQSPTVSAGSSG